MPATETIQSPASSPDVMTRTPRTKGVVRILTFFALIIVLLFAFDWLITFGLRRIPTGGFGVSNRFMSGQVNANVVISGSSRALAHYDPRVIQDVTGRTAFNLGRNGSQTDMQLAVLRAYLKRNQKPEVVLHNLDAFTFVTTREVYDPAQYVPYLYEPELYQALRGINPDIWKTKYLPLYGYVVDDMRFNWMLGIKGLLGRFPREDHFLGFNPRDKAWSDDFERYRADHPDGVTMPLEPAGERALEELTNVCVEKKIRLILVYSPEYGEMQALTKNRQEVFQRFREMAGRLEVEFWDFSGWEHSLDRKYFQNSQHLNATGARVFTQELASRLAPATVQNVDK